MTAKLARLKQELEQLLATHRAIEKAKHDEINAEKAQIWLARNAKKKTADKDIRLITSTLAEQLKVGDYVKVSGARSCPHRQVVEINGGFAYGENGRKWSPGTLHGRVITVRGEDKRPTGQVEHDIRLCGLEKITHVWDESIGWVKVSEFVNRFIQHSVDP